MLDKHGRLLRKCLILTKEAISPEISTQKRQSKRDLLSTSALAYVKDLFPEDNRLRNVIKMNGFYPPYIARRISHYTDEQQREFFELVLGVDGANLLGAKRLAVLFVDLNTLQPDVIRNPALLQDHIRQEANLPPDIDQEVLSIATESTRHGRHAASLRLAREIGEGVAYSNSLSILSSGEIISQLQLIDLQKIAGDYAETIVVSELFGLQRKLPLS